ncbi:diguanylate cyclase [Thalassotalea nanhaiensis]|uniref:diguanylate cyclase n=1 Tax=Thalassotalea nanhaiensis TaxID=3065648 RepID=A0ABY9TKJ4_9GAMM|nr:diguanylate cyclase [Colwelliaceae bacterium SQ345]
MKLNLPQILLILSVLFSAKVFAENKQMDFYFSPNWSPLNWTDEQGKLQGINIDFANLISTKVGYKANISKVPYWPQVLENIESANGDLTLGGTAHDDWEKQFLLSKPYVSFPLAIASRNQSQFFADISFLAGKKVAVGATYTVRHILETDYQDVIIVPVATTYQGLDLLEQGQVDAVLDILPVLMQRLRDKSYKNIDIGGVFSEKLELLALINKDKPEVLQVVNQAIDNITVAEKKAILDIWLHNKLQVEHDDQIVHLIVLILLLLLIGLFVRQSKLKKKHRALSSAYIRDTLTNTYSRGYAQELLSRCFADAKRNNIIASVVMFDIDYFKNINDSYNHAIGDKILIEFSQLIEKNIETNDSFGRWGGEEFILICPNTSSHQAVVLSEKLRSLVENHTFSNDIRISFSAGVVQLDAGLTIKLALDMADNALYQSKRNGRNQVTLASEAVTGIS